MPDNPAAAKPTQEGQWWLQDGLVPEHDAGTETEVSNRRRHDRIAIGTRAEAFELSEHGTIGGRLECEVADVSRSGLGLMCRRMVYGGRRLFVRVGLTGGRRKVLFGVVRYSRYDANGMYHVGMEFEKPPQEEGVRKWLRENGRDE